VNPQILFGRYRGGGAGGRFFASPRVWAANLGKDLRVMRTLAAAVTAALALSLTACSEDDPEPRVAPTESASPSTPDTSPTQPPDQEPWEKNTRAGAVAFVKRWFAVFSEAMPDGHVAELRAISSPKCVTCGNFADRAEAIYRDGGFYESKGWRVLRATIGPQIGLPRNVTKMLLKVLRGAERSKENATAEVVTNPDSTADYEARVEWVNGAWRLERLVLLS
jgi:hypothetical protein